MTRLLRLQLFRKRSLPDANEKDQGTRLRKILGPADLVMMGLGATVGTGIFVVSGIATSIAGPGIIVSFLIASICCLCVAFCYAELSALIPLTGSAYTYTYTIFGEILAWLVGWSIMLELIIGISVIASGWSQYVTGLSRDIGITLPVSFTQDAGNGGFIDLLAIFIIFLMVCILIQGIRESARANAFLVAIKLIVLGIFFWFGFQAIQVDHFTPFFPTGLHGVLTGAGLIIISYLGFEFVSNSAEEVRNPQKSLPLGLIGTIIISTVLYILTGIVLVGLVPYTEYANVAAPIIFAFNHAGVYQAGGIVAVGALIGITSGLLVCLYGASRMVYAMSRDGLLPSVLSEINANGIPMRATLMVGSVGAVLAAFTPIELLTELLNMGTLVAFISVASGVLFMRHLHPELPRSFRCPLVPVIPALAIISCLILIASLKSITLVWYGIWISAGLIVYLTYGQKGSRLGKEADER